MPFEREAEADGGRLRWAGAGLEFAVLVGLFFLGGRALDAKFGTDPWATAGLSLLGVALGTWGLIRRAVREERAEEAARRRGEREP
jgi:F0F1-type ATP synthase assembly protein I